VSCGKLRLTAGVLVTAGSTFWRCWAWGCTALWYSRDLQGGQKGRCAIRHDSSSSVIAKHDLEYLRMTAHDHGYRTQWRGRFLQIRIHHLIARWRTSRPVRFISLDNLNIHLGRCFGELPKCRAVHQTAVAREVPLHAQSRGRLNTAKSNRHPHRQCPDPRRTVDKPCSTGSLRGRSYDRMRTENPDGIVVSHLRIDVPVRKCLRRRAVQRCPR
jgi:hypothetical protein